MNHRNILIFGATGQAKMIRSIAISMFCPFETLRFFLVDQTEALSPPFGEFAVMYTGKNAYEDFLRCSAPKNEFDFAVGIGNPNGKIRHELHTKLLSGGFNTRNWIHATAFVDDSAILGMGSHVHPGAIINPQAQIGECCIINTNSVVEHGCKLGNGVEVGPSATLCGQITVGDYAWIGAGATVLPNLHIGTGAIVGAGAVVTKDVPDGTTVIGVPAREMK